MKSLKNNISECIKLYLNDLNDYGDEIEDILLAEYVLSNFKTLLTESNEDPKILLTETIKKSTAEHKQVFKDFLEYLENI